MFVRIDRVRASVDQRHFKINERITRDGSALRGFDNAFFDRGTEVRGNASPEDLVNPFESAASFKRFEDTFAIAELSASARLFLVSALNFDLLRNGFLIRNFRRVKRYFDVIAVV